MTRYNDNVKFYDATIEVKNVTDAISDFMNKHMAELLEMEEDDSRQVDNIYVTCATNMMRWSAEEIGDCKPTAFYYVTAKPNKYTSVHYDVWMDADGVDDIGFKCIDIEPLDMADMFR